MPKKDIPKKNNSKKQKVATIRSSAAEYLTFVSAVGAIKRYLITQKQ